MAEAISLMDSIIMTYITTTMSVATRKPPQPAVAMPPFQPEKLPEMTAATPMPHKPHTPAERCRVRLSKYSASAR